MLKRILVGLGGADYNESAIRHALALADVHDAEVTGVSIVDESRLRRTGPVPLGGGHYAQQLAEDRLAKAKALSVAAVSAFQEMCQATSIRHQVLHEVGEPFDLLIDRARYYDLMVFGLRSLFEFDLVPDPQSALVRLVQAGVRPLLAVSKEYHAIRKVLISYSGSMESAKAMKRFVELRLWPDAVLRVVTFEHGASQAKQLVRDAADYCRAHGFEVDEANLPETAKDHLLPYAEQWGADMIVVGNSAKNLIYRQIFGETALNAIQHANRPLFLSQ
jgi:nucleotide-binding universal stress UspA family protein